MTQEPCFAQHTCILRLCNPVSLDGDSDVVAIAAAKCANHMIYLHNVHRSRFRIQGLRFIVHRLQSRIQVYRSTLNVER